MVPGHLGGLDVVHLSESQQDLDTETGQPEEPGESGELVEEGNDDTSAGVGQDTLMELVLNNQYQVGEREEEKEGDLDVGHIVVPELLTGAGTDDDNNDAHDAEVFRMRFVVGNLL